MTCPDHKTYKAVRPPLCECIICWGMYLQNNPDACTRIRIALAVIDISEDRKKKEPRKKKRTA